MVIESSIISATVVISSTGGAAQYVGEVLGQYEYLEDKGYYVQTSTEQSEEEFHARYLYRDEDDYWYVYDTPGEMRGWLQSRRPSKTLPSTGWKYSNGESLQDDLSLTVTQGPLPPLPRQFTVTATGAEVEKWPSFLGVFNRTQRWWYGRPVYINTEGVLLYHTNNDHGWVIGDTFGKRGLSGSRSHHSPASEDNWRYWTGSEWKPASVTVTGSD